MRIYTKSVLLWDDSRQRYVTDEAESEWYEYSGPVALCKGDSTAKAAEQQQASFNAQLMSIFQQQFGKQSAIMDYLKGKIPFQTSIRTRRRLFRRKSLLTVGETSLQALARS
jgi:hypothetical protein